MPTRRGKKRIETLTGMLSKRGEYLGFWLALIILAAVAITTYKSTEAAEGTLVWLGHTHQVLQKIEELSGLYARAASARRAYIIAGDESELTDAPELDARLGRAIDDVRALVADNQRQLPRVDSLRQLLHQRMEGLDASVEHRRLHGTAAETADGLALVAGIRTIREAMDAEENQLIVDRYARTRREMGRAKLTEVVGTMASFTILVFAFRRLRQEIDWRRSSELALRTGEAFLSSIVENIPDMIFVKEARELRFERINRAGEDLLGIKRDDLLRKNDYDFFPHDQAEAFRARDRQTLANRVVVDIPEEPVQTKAGERWLHTKKVPILDERGVPTYLLGISADITEPRQAVVALNRAKDAAEAANQELEAFSYSVAHDLQAPLRAIDGFSQALEEDSADKLDASGIEYLRRVRTSAQQMAHLIDGLLGLSRLTRTELAREKVDLTRIAHQSVARLREAYPLRHVDLVVQDGLVADGDVRLLTAVLDNLLGNAWKFTSKCARSRIEVGRRTEGGCSVFFVSDNGAGFEQAYVHKLFSAFQRLHSTTEFEGSGIGLATVERIIRKHGGRIWAEGAVGAGATFNFTL